MKFFNKKKEGKANIPNTDDVVFSEVEMIKLKEYILKNYSSLKSVWHAEDISCWVKEKYTYIINDIQIHPERHHEYRHHMMYKAKIMVCEFNICNSENLAKEILEPKIQEEKENECIDNLKRIEDRRIKIENTKNILLKLIQ